MRARERHGVWCSATVIISGYKHDRLFSKLQVITIFYLHFLFVLLALYMIMFLYMQLVGYYLFV